MLEGFNPPVLVALVVLPALLGLAILVRGLRPGFGGLLLGLTTGGLVLLTVLVLSQRAMVLAVQEGPEPPSLMVAGSGLRIHLEGRRVAGPFEAVPFQMEVRARVEEPARALHLQWASENRSGTIDLEGLDRSTVTWAPMDWPEGERRTQASCLWISPKALKALRDRGEAEWANNPRGAAIHWGLGLVDECMDRLRLARRTGHRLSLDGRTATLAALEVRDGKGNTYVVLDRPENPMVVAFVPNRLTLGIILFDGLLLWTPVNYLSLNDGYTVDRIDRDDPRPARAGRT